MCVYGGSKKYKRKTQAYLRSAGCQIPENEAIVHHGNNFGFIRRIISNDLEIVTVGGCVNIRQLLQLFRRLSRAVWVGRHLPERSLHLASAVRCKKPKLTLIFEPEDVKKNLFQRKRSPVSNSMENYHNETLIKREKLVTINFTVQAIVRSDKLKGVRRRSLQTPNFSHGMSVNLRLWSICSFVV